jgi:hypothetical protein
MINARETIFNYGEGKTKDQFLKEIGEAIDKWIKMGLTIDEIVLEFQETPKYQSNPEEGNLPKHG